MALQQRLHPQARERTPQASREERAATEPRDLGITDDLLDEIDAVLEDNAEEMVRNYVQKGGQ